MAEIHGRACQCQKVARLEILGVRLSLEIGLFIDTLGWAFGFEAASLPLMTSFDGRRGFGLAARRRLGIIGRHTPTPNGSLPGVYGSGGGAERAITLFNPVFAF